MIVLMSKSFVPFQFANYFISASGSKITMQDYFKGSQHAEREQQLCRITLKGASMQ